MSKLVRRDGLILAILAAVTLIPAGIGLTSVLRELLSGEIEGLAGRYLRSGAVGKPGNIDKIRAHGEDELVTFDHDIQPVMGTAVNHPWSAPVPIVRDEATAALPTTTIATTRVPAAASTIHEAQKRAEVTTASIGHSWDLGRSGSATRR